MLDNDGGGKDFKDGAGVKVIGNGDVSEIGLEKSGKEIIIIMRIIGKCKDMACRSIGNEDGSAGGLMGKDGIFEDEFGEFLEGVVQSKVEVIAIESGLFSRGFVGRILRF